MQEHVYLKLNLLLLKFLGYFPTNFKQQPLNKIHGTYSILLKTFFLTFHIFQYIEALFLYLDGKMDEVSAIGSLALLYTALFFKLRTVSNTNHLVEEIRRSEAEISRETDPTILGLYNRSRKISRGITWSYIVCGYFILLQMITNPKVLERKKFGDCVNGTLGFNKRALPLEIWLPYRRENWYGITFAIDAVFAFIGCSTAISVDTYLFALLIHTKTQLKILQCKFTNIRKYVRNSSGKNYKRNAKLHVKKFILFHKRIINFAEILDANMRLAMFVDFAVASVRLAMTAIRVMTENSTIKILTALQTISILASEQFIFYWFANEITVESSNVIRAIWDSKWYELPVESQLELKFVMMRCSKPIELHVGSFYTMSTATLTGVLKATYSYITLLRSTNDRN